MPNDPPSDSFALTASRRTLGLMTCLGAIDGTILMMAATGRLNSLGAAVVVGLTVISGSGAWIAAREAFGPGRRDARALLALAGLSVAATIAAAWLGTSVAGAVELHVLPKVLGAILFLVAAEVGGLRLPKLKGAPLPVVAVAAAALLEVLWWIP